jgi:hypothetical protein
MGYKAVNHGGKWKISPVGNRTMAKLINLRGFVTGCDLE